MKPIAALICVFFVSSGFAAERADRPDLNALPDLPEPPAEVRSGEPLEPDVTIIETDRETVEEYRVNGQLYMVKVTPKGGFPPYYFVDTDGDGQLETRQFGLAPKVLVPQWILFSW